MNPEIEFYLNTLNDLRGKVLAHLEGMDSAGLNWTPTAADTNSLYVLATHSIGAEHGWIFETIGEGPSTRNRPAEFQARGDSLDALKADYARVAGETQDVLSRLTAEDLAKTRSHHARGQITVRWAIMHVILHYAEHLGQMDLTKQLFEGR